MNETRFCEHCGAALAADARFCEKCGNPVAPTAQPAPPFPSAAPAVGAARPAAPLAPAATAPRSTNRGLIVGLAIVGVLVALGCLAVGVFGFWFLQSNPATPGQSPVGTPQVAGMPTRVEPTVGLPRATTQPLPTVATGAPTPMPTLPIASPSDTGTRRSL